MITSHLRTATRGYADRLYRHISTNEATGQQSTQCSLTKGKVWGIFPSIKRGPDWWLDYISISPLTSVKLCQFVRAEGLGQRSHYIERYYTENTLKKNKNAKCMFFQTPTASLPGLAQKLENLMHGSTQHIFLNRVY